MNIEDKMKEVRKDCREGRIDLKRVLLIEVKEMSAKEQIDEVTAFGKWIENEAKRRFDISRMLEFYT